MEDATPVAGDVTDKEPTATVGVVKRCVGTVAVAAPLREVGSSLEDGVGGTTQPTPLGEPVRSG